MAPKQPLARLIGHTWEPPGQPALRIMSVSKTRSEPGHYGPDKPSLEWLLDYTLTPFGRYKVGDPRRPWKSRGAFEAHLYPPGTRKWEDTTTVALPHTASLFITFLSSDRARLEALIRDHGYARFTDSSRRLLPLLERILQGGLELGDQGYWQAQAALYEIVALLHQSLPLREESHAVPPPEDVGSPFSDFVRAVRSCLHDRLGGRVTRDDLARRLHTSVSSLAGRYRAETGESPMKTLARMRVNLAKSLIFRGYRLKAIAEQTGFCDEYHLSRVFKRLEGVCPRAYRQQRLVAPLTAAPHRGRRARRRVRRGCGQTAAGRA